MPQLSTDKNFLAYCDRRIAEAKNEIRLYEFLKAVRPLLEMLPDCPSPRAINHLFVLLDASESYLDAWKKLREYLAQWPIDTWPNALFVEMYAKGR